VESVLGLSSLTRRNFLPGLASRFSKLSVALRRDEWHCVSNLARLRQAQGALFPDIRFWQQGDFTDLRRKEALQAFALARFLGLRPRLPALRVARLRLARQRSFLGRLWAF
jgi:hypothetical protein